MYKSLLSLLVIASFSTLFASNAAVGDWLTPEKDSIIRVYKCGSKFCGKIQCLKQPNDKSGKPKTDTENEKASLRSRAILGLKFMKGFKWDDGEYVDGTIYNSRNGKTYCGKMYLEGGKLNLKGRICYTFLGKTNVWTKTNAASSGMTCAK